MKKALLALVFTLLSLNVAKGAETVYINTPQEFIQFSKSLNPGTHRDATVYIQNDLDFTGLSGQFEPIGTIYTTAFYGTLDGQGHTISNLAYHNPRYWYAGLIGISQGATVRNIIMDKTCSITGISALNTSSHAETMAYGGIVGACQASRRECIITNNVFMGKVEFSGITEKNINLHIGGIVGDTGAAGYTVVSNCANYGTVSFTGKTDLVSMGGVVGTLLLRYYNSYGYSRFYNCINYGFLSFTGTATKMLKLGGVIGSNEYKDVQIDNMVNFGIIHYTPKAHSTYEKIGAITGMISYITAKRLYWVTGSSYDVVGSFNDDQGSVVSVSNFTASNLRLEHYVVVSGHAGNSLIQALNLAAEINVTAKYSHWLHNEKSYAISFFAGSEVPFFKMSSQLILMPNLVDGAKNFDGWYTDKACTTKLSSYYVKGDLNLYAKYV